MSFVESKEAVRAAIKMNRARSAMASRVDELAAAGKLPARMAQNWKLIKESNGGKTPKKPKGAPAICDNVSWFVTDFAYDLESNAVLLGGRYHKAIARYVGAAQVAMKLEDQKDAAVMERWSRRRANKGKIYVGATLRDQYLGEIGIIDHREPGSQAARHDSFIAGDLPYDEGVVNAGLSKAAAASSKKTRIRA
jgi:hypothetical protein